MARSFLHCAWTPEVEASWRRDIGGIWQTLEEESRQESKQPTDQLMKLVSRSVGPFSSRG
jgi:hypothetical protein